MHAQMSKEWRLLRPGLVAAIGLAIIPLVLPVDSHSRETVNYLLTFCMFLGGVLLGIETFGREFHQQTSTLWLALPISRGGLWQSKLSMVGLAVAGVTLVHWVALLVGAPWRGFLPSAVEAVRPVVAIAGGAVLGVCWSVLLRQTWAALWMSLITPGALMMLIQLLVVLFWPVPETDQVTNQPDIEGMFAFGFCLVGMTAFFLARRRFNQLEDLGPVGEDVQLKAPRFLQNVLRVGARPERPSRSANSSLWWKEIRLQQVNLALAGGFAVIMLLAQILRRVALSMPERFNPRDLEVFDFVWAFWSLLPLTIGLASFAEERRIGVDSWQQTLPVSRARRWWIKIGVAYSLAFAIGVVVPVIGEQLFRSDPFTGMLMFHGLAWLIMTTAGIYVSSIARNLVHAISILVPFVVALGLALAGGLWLVEVLGPGPIQRYAVISAEQHFTAVIGALLFVALLWQAWRNGVPNPGEGLAWRFNVAAIVAVWLIAVLSVAGTRSRVWESLRSEPAPMPALATIPGVQPDVVAALTHVTVLTPEGSLWNYGSPGLFQVSKVLRQLGVEHTWLSIGAGESRVYAVRSDGTLWRWGQELIYDPDQQRWTRLDEVESSWVTPAQIGVDGDWRAVAATTTHSVALKTDGSLWGWGNNLDGQLGETDTQYVSAPTRLGTETNWICVAAGQALSVAANRHGEVWLWGRGRGRRGADGRPSRFPNPERLAAGPTWKRLFADGERLLGLTEAGEIRLLKDYSWQAQSPDLVSREMILGRDVILDAYEVWAIGAGGHLLQWHYWDGGYGERVGLPTAEKFRRIGKRADWIALESSYGLVSCAGLTADGGLWVWGKPFGSHEPQWLPPSRRPRQVALLRTDGN